MVLGLNLYSQRLLSFPYLCHMKNAFRYILTILFLLAIQCAVSAQVLIFHNAPDTLISTLKVKIGDGPVQSVNFRTTSIYSIGGDVDGNISIFNSADSLLLSTPVSLLASKFYHCYINGNSTMDGYASNPSGTDNALRADFLSVSDLPEPGPDQSRVIFLHGGPDLPSTDVTLFPSNDLVDNLSFGEYAVVNLKSDSNNINFRTADSSLLLVTFNLPLEGRVGQTVVVLLSGYIAPPINRNGPVLRGYMVVPGGDYILLNNVTSVRDTKMAKSISIYPNPAKNQIRMAFTPQISGRMSIGISDMSGRQLSFRNVDAEKHESLIIDTDLSNLPSGQYLMTISDGNEVSVLPFIVQK